MTLINLLSNDRSGVLLRAPCGFFTDVKDYLDGNDNYISQYNRDSKDAMKLTGEYYRQRDQNREGYFYFTGLNDLLSAAGAAGGSSMGMSYGDWISLANAGIGAYAAISGAYNANKASENTVAMNAANIELQRETNAQNMQLAREYNQSQENIANAANQTNMQRDLLSYERQRQLAFDMFNAENEYNTPLRQMDRLADAGINPSVAFGSSSRMASSTGQGSMSAPSSPNQSQTVVPNQQMAQLQAPQNTFAPIDTSRNLSEILQALSNAGATFENSRSTRALVEGQVKELMSRSNLNEQNVIYQKILNFLKSEYGEKIEDASYRKILSGIKKDVADADVSSSQILLNNTAAALNWAQKTASNVSVKVQLATLQKELDLLNEKANTERHLQGYYDKSGNAAVAQAEAAKMQGQAALNTSSANLLNARVNARAQEVLNGYYQALTSEAGMRTRNETFKTAREALQFLADHNVMQLDDTMGRRYDIQKLLSEAEVARFHADYPWLDNVTNLLGSCVIGAGVGYSAYETRQTAMDKLYQHYNSTESETRSTQRNRKKGTSETTINRHRYAPQRPKGTKGGLSRYLRRGR